MQDLVYTCFDHITVVGIIGHKVEPHAPPLEGIPQHTFGNMRIILALLAVD